jgi:hypothetical protein
MADIHTIDLTKYEAKHAKNQSHKETKTNLAILHQQNQNQMLKQIKQEKIVTMITLENMRGAKQAVDANLEGSGRILRMPMD